MPDQRPSDVLGSLPRTRPQRRSAKRPVRDEEPTVQTAVPASRSAASKGPRAANATRAAKPKPSAAKRPASGSRARRANPQTLRQPPQPRGIPSQPRAEVPPHRPEVLGTAVQAAAELAEIGLALGARALRRAVSRIPRP